MNKRIIKESAWIALAQLVSVVANFFTGVFLARSLSVENLGEFQLFLSYFALLSLFSLPGFNAPLRRGILKGYDNFSGVVIRHSFSITSVVSLLLIASGICFYFLLPNDDIPTYLLLLGLMLPSSVLEKYDNILLAKKDFFSSRGLLVAFSLIKALIICITAFLTNDLIATLVSLLVFRIIFLPIGWFVAYKKLKLCEKNKEFESDLQKQGKRLTFLSVISQASLHLDKVLLGVIDPALLAIYFVGTAIPKSIKNNTKIILSVPLIYWGGDNIRNNIISLQKYLFRIFMCGMVLTLITFLLLPFVIPYAYGEAYNDSIIVAQIASASFALIFCSTSIHALDTYQSASKFTTNQQTILKLLKSASFIFFIPKFGVYGALIINLIYELIEFFSCVLFLRKKKVEHL